MPKSSVKNEKRPVKEKLAPTPQLTHSVHQRSKSNIIKSQMNKSVLLEHISGVKEEPQLKPPASSSRKQVLRKMLRKKSESSMEV